MSDYPVGAKWIGKETGVEGSGDIGNRHRTAEIYLDERRGDFEIWKWKWYYYDGSHPVNSFDWAISYRSAKNSIPFSCRMKRVK